MTLTCVSGEENARSVFCARVEGTGGDLDLAYLDIPSSAEFPGMLDFVQAASRQAGWAAQAMLKAEAKAEMQVIDDQLSMAREIQLRLIPQGLEHIKGVEVALCYEPAMWVGGDYCDVWQTEDERLVFAVGDVCGKGLPAAIIMANLHAAIRATMSSCPQPADAVRYLNSHLDRHVTYGQFITLVLGVFNPKTDEIRYVNAGHILPLVITPERQVETLGEPRNQPLGLASREIREDRGILKPGASLVIVTDGIVETQSTDGAMFGPEGVCRAIRTATNLSGRSLAEHLVQTAAEFRGLGPQRDDITALVMVHRGP
jgi:serine phosphatase RsbU (regulator of sigma subunit)